MIEPELRHAVDAAIERERAHLIELIERGDRNRRVLEVFVDAETGITTEMCAAISRSIAAAIEASGLIPGAYRLDVSSPGIDRPLAFPWQYPKHIGRTLRVSGTPENVSGTLTEVREDGITLELQGRGEPVQLRFSEIKEARVVAPW